MNPSTLHFLRALPLGLATFALTLTVFWPLRHGEMIWTALGRVM